MKLALNIKGIAAFFAALACAPAAHAETAHLSWKTADGKWSSEGVYRTAWGDGSEIVVNYSDKPFAYRGKDVSPLDWRLYGGAGR